MRVSFDLSISTISAILNIRFSLPALELDQETVQKAIEVASILRTGRTEAPVKSLNLPREFIIRGPTSLQNARKILEYFDDNGSIPLYEADNVFPVSIELLGHQIDLGKAQFFFPSREIIRIDALRDLLSRQDIHEDTAIFITAIVDRNDIYAEFLDWPKE